MPLHDIAETVSRLNIYERERRAFIKARIRIENMARARALSALGFDPKNGVAEEAMRKRAQRIIDAIHDGTEPPADDAAVAESVREFVAAVLLPLPLLEKAENAKVKEMEKLAKALPVAAFVEGAACNGFGMRGLAVLTAICHGDAMQGLADFPNPAKVWRRCGLESNPTVQISQTYKLNRSQMFAFIYDPMVRAQVRAPKEDGKRIKGEPALPIGPYGAIYLERKNYYGARIEATADLPATIDGAYNKEKWTPKRADMAARRYMAKRLLLDLWRAWREADALLSPSVTVPRADSSPGGGHVVNDVPGANAPDPEKPKRARRKAVARGDARANVKPRAEMRRPAASQDAV